ncbi:hypothetical protein L195_g048874 [Trifolium pratense]|uniref:Uncharacterized protein n=1 Tax=Trifolium pratense TaxID=57577 RepID=A0A2K3JMI4_TRIPR|nr:hypothetical protein L195_g048874 [Trifolium pratense]
MMPYVTTTTAMALETSSSSAALIEGASNYSLGSVSEQVSLSPGYIYTVQDGGRWWLGCKRREKAELSVGVNDL